MVSKSFAVLGSPIEHSKSPLIHSTAYGVLGLDWTYGSFEVRKGGLPRFVENEGLEFAGFSVTMPLKDEAFRLSTQLNQTAILTGAVNTLVRVDSGWSGYNTDVFGIVQAVRAANLPSLQSFLIIGSGATATSAVVAVSELAPNAQVEIFARNAEARGNLVQFAKKLGLQAKSIANLKNAARASDLVIATLPSGALDDPAKKLSGFRGFSPLGAILDVAYSPWPSNFASHWLSAHKPTISGLEMLMWQAIAQLRIFISGDEQLPLVNEIAVAEAIRHALEI